MLDIRMETFLCVCKTMNYTRAAAQLGLTQPAVTQHIHYLERYFGVPLFTYEGRRLSLTAQGLYLKRCLETLRHDTLRICRDIKSIRERQHIYLGATLSIGDFYLPQKLAGLLREEPELDLSLTVADTAVLLQKLDEGVLDLALCEGYFNKSDYDWRPIRREAICGYCAADAPQKELRSIEDLFDRRLLLRERGSGTREIFDRYLYELGYGLSCFPSQCEISSPNLILQMLMAGQGISFLYECVAKGQVEAGTLRRLEIPGFSLSHEFALVWKKDSMFFGRSQGLMERFLE